MAAIGWASGEGSVEIAEAVQRAARREGRERLGTRAACPAAAPPPAPGRDRARGAASRRTCRTSGRFDQSALAVTWNSTIRPLPCGVGGDKRRAVGEAGPDLGRQIGGGLGQNLAVTCTPVSRARPAKGLVIGEGLQRLRRFPAKRAAERAAAFAEGHRNERILRRRPGVGRQSAAARRRARSRLRSCSCCLAAAARRYRPAPASKGPASSCALRLRPSAGSLISAKGSSARDT